MVIHGHLNGEIIAVGNGSAAPSDVTWSTLDSQIVVVSADAYAEDGQVITIKTATKYSAYFTVKVELLPPYSFIISQDSPTKDVAGSPIIQYPIHVIPEFPKLPLLLTFLAFLLVIVLSKRRLYRSVFVKLD